MCQAPVSRSQCCQKVRTVSKSPHGYFSPDNSMDKFQQNQKTENGAANIFKTRRTSGADNQADQPGQDARPKYSIAVITAPSHLSASHLDYIISRSTAQQTLRSSSRCPQSRCQSSQFTQVAWKHVDLSFCGIYFLGQRCPKNSSILILLVNNPRRLCLRDPPENFGGVSWTRGSQRSLSFRRCCEFCCETCRPYSTP